MQLGQGERADESYSEEAVSSLRAAVRGRTIKVGEQTPTSLLLVQATS